MNSVTAVRTCGISYRQLDWWIRKGWVKGGTPGHGHQRDLTGEEFAVLRHMAALVKAGLSPSDAAPLARRLAEGTPVMFGPWALAPLGGSV